MASIAFNDNREYIMFPNGYDLRTLFVFTCVVETSGMTQAAKVLNMTQSSISQSIGNLEAALGTQLFDRSVRPMTLTVAGNTLYEKSKGLLESASRLLRETQESENLTFETLTLGLAESFANTVGPELVRQLPHLARKWRILAGTSPVQHEALLNYEVDLVVSTSDQIMAQEGLNLHTIMEEPFVLVFPKTYDGPVDSIASIEGLPFIRSSSRSSLGRQIERQIKRLRLHLPIHSELDTATAQLKMVALGGGWSITTPICLLQEIEQLHNLQVCPIQKGSFSRKLTLISRSSEMEKTAEKVALKSQQILRDQLMPELFKHIPWLENKLIWGFQ